MGLNRIKKYEDDPKAQCVVVSDTENGSVHVTHNNSTLTWKITSDGILCPGSESPIGVHCLAAEAIVAQEIQWLLEMNDVASKTIYINPAGEATPVTLVTPEMLKSPDLLFKKQLINSLYSEFVAADYTLSEDIVKKAMDCNVLEPFLSLVNL